MGESDILALIKKIHNDIDRDKNYKKLLEQYNEFLNSITISFRRGILRQIDYDDVYSQACLGFIKAVNKFDVNSGNKFFTYMYRIVKNELRNFYNKNKTRLDVECIQDNNFIIDVKDSKDFCSTADAFKNTENLLFLEGLGKFLNLSENHCDLYRFMVENRLTLSDDAEILSKHFGVTESIIASRLRTIVKHLRHKNKKIKLTKELV